jgi:tetratricopeptide (TPR) repeat protein
MPLTPLSNEYPALDDDMDRGFLQKLLNIQASIDVHSMYGGEVNAVKVNVNLPRQPVRALHQLRPPTPDFVGRSSEIDQLISALSQINDSGIDGSVCGIHGMGGVGKTQLALVVGNRLKDYYSDGQIIIDLHGVNGTPVSQSAALQTLIRAFEPDINLSNELDKLNGLYLSLLHGKRVMIIADDARDAAQIRPLLPPPGCALLITSRQKFVLPGMLMIDLWKLSDEEAINLLIGICPRIDIDAMDIARSCGNLPLALRVSASLLISSPDLDIKEYIERLTVERERLSHLRDAEDSELDVEASLNLSYSVLDVQSQNVLQRLSVFRGYFDKNAANAIVANTNKEDLISVEQSLSLLQRRSLLEWDKNLERYHQHDLIRVFAAIRMEGDFELSLRHARYYLQVARITDSLYQHGSDGIRRAFDMLDLDRQNIASGWAWSLANQDIDAVIAGGLIQGFANTMLAAGRLRYMVHREKIMRLEREIALSRGYRDDLYICGLIVDIARSHSDLGEYKVALSYIEQAVVIISRLENPEMRLSVLECFGRIVLSKNRQDSRGVEMLEEAISISRILGDKVKECSLLADLGFYTAALDDIERASSYSKTALDMAKEIGNRSIESRALNALAGALYYSGNQYKEALELYSQALTIDQETGNHSGQMAVLYNIALCYDKTGDIDLATRFREDALEISRRFGEWHKEREQLCLLGDGYAKKKEFLRSKSYFQQALMISRDIGDKSGEAETLKRIGDVCMRMGKLQEAVFFFTQAFEICSLLEETDVLAEVFWGLGGVREKMNNYEEAIKCYIKCFRASTQSEDKRTLKRSIGRVDVLLHWKVGQYDEDDDWSRAKAIIDCVGDLTLAVDLLLDVATSYEYLNHTKKAIIYYKKGRRLASRLRISDKYNLIIEGLVRCYRRMGWHNRAEELLQGLPVNSR